MCAWWKEGTNSLVSGDQVNDATFISYLKADTKHQVSALALDLLLNSHKGLETLVLCIALHWGENI